MQTLRNRLIKYTNDNGVKISFLANDADVDLQALYRMNSDKHNQKSISEPDTIKLHEYLKERGY